MTADLELLGVPEPATRLAQTTVALLGALLVWVAFRRLPRALAIPVLVAATCLATPHAFLYDLPMLTGAVLLLIAERQRTEAPFRLPEIVLLVLLLALPMVMVCSERHVPVSSLALALFIMIILMGGNGVMSGNPALPQGSPGTYRHDAAFGSIMDAGNKQAARVE